MERMEVEPSPAAAAAAAGGGGALRRSNSAPLLPGATGSPSLDQGPGPQRIRRCSVCLESGGGGGGGPEGEAAAAVPRDLGARSGRLQPPPNTSPPSATLETLKRKGGLQVDSPPTKLFVIGGVPITPPTL